MQPRSVHGRQSCLRLGQRQNCSELVVAVVAVVAAVAVVVVPVLPTTRQPQLQPMPATPPLLSRRRHPHRHAPSPPLPDLIARILAVETQREGDMSEAEALEILNVTDRRPKWLLSQVHPDRHPCFRDEATAAAKRVNQAMDVRTRHVTEVSYDSD